MFLEMDRYLGPSRFCHLGRFHWNHSRSDALGVSGLDPQDLVMLVLLVFLVLEEI